MLKTYQRQRVANGPDAVRAADAVRRAQAQRNEWPYVHVYPPPNSIRRNPTAYINCPAAGVQATILTFGVPSGYWFFMAQLGLFFSSAAFNPGDFLFSVDKNTPLGGGAFQGVPLTDLQNIGFPFGAFANGPWSLARAELFAPEDVIRAKVTNVNLAGGAPNVFGAMFGGWLVPAVEFGHAE
jgi:hypothetical protein